MKLYSYAYYLKTTGERVSEREGWRWWAAVRRVRVWFWQEAPGEGRG